VRHLSHAWIHVKMLILNRLIILFFGGTRRRSWLRHYATNRKDADSIPDVITKLFHWHNTSGHSKELGSTLPLTKISTRNISWNVRQPVREADKLPPLFADQDPQFPGTVRARAEIFCLLFYDFHYFIWNFIKYVAKCIFRFRHNNYKYKQKL
jgi:hypothetical protein